MAHNNIDQRRSYVKRLITLGKEKRQIVKLASEKFNCSVSAIGADISFINNQRNTPAGCHSAQGIKLKVFKRDSFVCQYCLKEKEHLVIEHIVPTYHGGLRKEDNLTTACAGCNTGKGRQIWVPHNFMRISKDNIEFRDFVLSNAVRDFR